jgi:multidrug efflux pump
VAVGTGVVGGMIAATAFGIFFVPVFYLATRKWLMRSKPMAPGVPKEAGNE